MKINDFFYRIPGKTGFFSFKELVYLGYLIISSDELIMWTKQYLKPISGGANISWNHVSFGQFWSIITGIFFCWHESLKPSASFWVFFFIRIVFLRKRNKRSVLRRQSRNTNWNIKRSVFYSLTFRALALRQRETAFSERLHLLYLGINVVCCVDSWCTADTDSI